MRDVVFFLIAVIVCFIIPNYLVISLQQFFDDYSMGNSDTYAVIPCYVMQITNPVNLPFYLSIYFVYDCHTYHTSRIVLDNAAMKFVNEYWPSLYREMLPFLAKNWDERLTELSNRIFSKISFSKTFP